MCSVAKINWPMKIRSVYDILEMTITHDIVNDVLLEDIKFWLCNADKGSILEPHYKHCMISLKSNNPACSCDFHNCELFYVVKKHSFKKTFIGMSEYSTVFLTVLMEFARQPDHIMGKSHDMKQLAQHLSHCVC